MYGRRGLIRTVAFALSSAQPRVAAVLVLLLGAASVVATIDRATGASSGFSILGVIPAFVGLGDQLLVAEVLALLFRVEPVFATVEGVVPTFVTFAVSSDHFWVAVMLVLVLLFLVTPGVDINEGLNLAFVAFVVFAVAMAAVLVLLFRLALGVDMID